MALELSILICTTSKRSEIIKPLLLSLSKQIVGYDDLVEVLINDHETDNVGKKRNDLLIRAKGNYVVAIDSDDEIVDNYISLVLNAIKSDADCIGICGWMTTNGGNKRDWFISKTFKNWHERDYKYYRTPNHISPIKRELALKAMFPEIKFGEDFEYSVRVLPYLKTEIIITERIYHYKYVSNK